VLNAANEVAVAQFLAGNIGFYTITESVLSVVDSMQYAKDTHTLDGIIECDREARRKAERVLGL
jgi:1-deoxy-D-xylulose 5-phosphate reductoisomerase